MYFLCSSIKPFAQQAYPIQPAVTTAISSENLFTLLIKNDPK